MSFQDRFNQYDAIWDFSNPLKAQQKAFKIYGDKAILYRSNTKTKKYAIKAPNGRIVNFGQMGYEDFLKHENVARKMNYLNRSANIKGNWKNDPYSPNNLSRRILWD
jgi:hypothetical protein